MEIPQYVRKIYEIPGYVFRKNAGPIRINFNVTPIMSDAVRNDPIIISVDAEEALGLSMRGEGYTIDEAKDDLAHKISSELRFLQMCRKQGKLERQTLRIYNNLRHYLEDMPQEA